MGNEREKTSASATPQPTAQIMSTIALALEPALQSYACANTKIQGDEDSGLPLLDALTPRGDSDTQRGYEEIGLLADFLYGELKTALDPATPQPADTQDAHFVQWFEKDHLARSRPGPGVDTSTDPRTGVYAQCWQQGGDSGVSYCVRTPNGEESVISGDWIIIKDGKRYVCDQELFDAISSGLPVATPLDVEAEARLAEIRERLAKITSGWYIDKYTISGILYRIFDKYHQGVCKMTSGGEFHDKPHAELIANAPTDIDFLLTLVSTARRGVWDDAICATRQVGSSIAFGEEYNEYHGLIVSVIEALERARDKQDQG